MRSGGTIFARLLPGLALLCLGAAVGCVRHGMRAGVGGYRLQMLPNVTLLLAPGLVEQAGSVQVTEVALGRSARGDAGGCAVRGSLFALKAGDVAGRWQMTSPTASAWNTPEIEAEADGEWSAFTRQLEGLVAAGCFPAGVSGSSAQRRIVEAIAVPADKVLRYYYSLAATGFLDLQPGMEIGIETVTDQARATSATVRLSVVDRPPAGVALEATTARGRGRKGGDAPVSTVPQRFSAMPLLRLFLERAATGTEEAREAMLLGATTSAEMDAATAVILQKGVAGCAGEAGGTRCLVFAGTGVSLLTEVSVNGRPAFYAPGWTLSQIVDSLPEPQRARAVATVSMERSSAAGFVPIEVPRTEEGQFNLLLVNGDRIRWRR